MFRPGRVSAFFLGILFLQSCYTDNAAHVLSPPRSVTCLASEYSIQNLCEDEKEYLDWAATAYPEWKFSDLTVDRLRDVVKTTKDVDKASALFFHRLSTDVVNQHFREDLERREHEPEGSPSRSTTRVLLALAPGMFYADNKTSIDSTGSSLRQVAASLGMKEAVIPTESTGTVERNASIICSYIATVDRDNSADVILLASASKGSSDIRMALRLCGQEPYFRRVRGWLSMGGILRGSHLVDNLLKDPVARWKARFYFWLQGYDWEGLRSLRHSPDGPLSGELSVPSHVTVVNVIGVPLFRHVTTRARPFYLFLIPYGPSDGMVLLADAYVPGTLVYASFRNDHYFQWPIPEQRIKALLLYMVDQADRTARR